MSQFNHVTTQASVEVYRASNPIFGGLIKEVRELSKKKPEATMNAGKIKLINRVLKDLLVVLKDESAGKYLELLDDESLPQVSDAVLMMVQFETALSAFEKRYLRNLSGIGYRWVTVELVAELEGETGDESLEDEET